MRSATKILLDNVAEINKKIDQIDQVIAEHRRTRVALVDSRQELTEALDLIKA